MPKPQTRVRKKAPVKTKRAARVRAVKARPATVTPTAKLAGRWERHFERARIVAGALVLVLMLLWTTNAVLAAQWVEPTQNPPGGNPPGFVWLQAESIIPQIGNLSVLGEAMFGGATLDLGIGDAGQNVIYGSAKESSMNAGDALVLVQTVNDQGAAKDRLRVTKEGSVIVSGKIKGDQFCIGDTCQANLGVALQNTTPGDQQTGNFNVSGTGIIGGNLKVNGCMGSVVVGWSGPTNGNRGGYIGANAWCNASNPESHMCSFEEVVRSVNCGAMRNMSPAIPDGTEFWISGGPPGYSAPANDCIGWTSDAGSSLGRYWVYDRNGGSGWLGYCSDITRRLGCCK